MKFNHVYKEGVSLNGKVRETAFRSCDKQHVAMCGCSPEPAARLVLPEDPQILTKPQNPIIFTFLLPIKNSFHVIIVYLDGFFLLACCLSDNPVNVCYAVHAPHEVMVMSSQVNLSPLHPFYHNLSSEHLSSWGIHPLNTNKQTNKPTPLCLVLWPGWCRCTPSRPAASRCSCTPGPDSWCCCSSVGSASSR